MEKKKWKIKSEKDSKTQENKYKQFVENYNNLNKNDLDDLRQSCSNFNKFTELCRTLEIEEDIEGASKSSNSDKIEEDIPDIMDFPED